MKLIIDFGLLAALSFSNTPYPNVPTLVPSLRVEVRPAPWLFFAQEDRARCNPRRVTFWNPKTASWTVEAGVNFGPLTLAVGHQSEHGIDKIWPETESFDFFRAHLRFESN